MRGTSGHGSMPLRTDNALVKAAEVVRRIDAYRPRTKILDLWRQFVESADLPPDIAAALVDPDKVYEMAAAFPDVGLARMMHA